MSKQLQLIAVYRKLRSLWQMQNLSTKACWTRPFCKSKTASQAEHKFEMSREQAWRIQEQERLNTEGGLTLKDRAWGMRMYQRQWRERRACAPEVARSSLPRSRTQRTPSQYRSGATGSSFMYARCTSITVISPKVRLNIMVLWAEIGLASENNKY